MDIIKRNTDYALRIIAVLNDSFHTGEFISARALSREAVVPYPLTCKLLQKLQKREIVKSEMGPRGGYFLAHSPDQISFLNIIETIQGPIRINRCFSGEYHCPLRGKCGLHDKLGRLQAEVVNSLQNSKIGDLGSKNEEFLKETKA